MRSRKFGTIPIIRREIKGNTFQAR